MRSRGRRRIVWLVVAAAACGGNGSRADREGDGGAALAGGGERDETSATPAEPQPAPAPGDGQPDPPTRSLHNRGCGGTDWQLVSPWVLSPHAAPLVGSADEMQRCVDRYAGWVTTEADDAGVSRASVYAALAASGQCDPDSAYDGALIPGELCTNVHPELDGGVCLEAMADQGFGIGTLARAIAVTAELHQRDVVPMAAVIATGTFDCGGEDHWKVLAPDGYVDRYVAAYNAYTARTNDVPSCAKRLVVTVALYTGMDDPGDDGVARGNGCWTYERVSKWNGEWKICNYDGTVHHPDGVKWAYDDTNTNHSAALETSRIHDCMEGVEGRGYVYMTNRGYGWPKRVTEGVTAHFAQLYSGQHAINDQQSLWVSSGKPGQPMVHFGEPTTGMYKIGDVTTNVCDKVDDGGHFGVYLYPEALRAHRMNAMVEALNACTGG